MSNSNIHSRFLAFGGSEENGAPPVEIASSEDMTNSEVAPGTIESSLSSSSVVDEVLAVTDKESEQISELLASTKSDVVAEDSDKIESLDAFFAALGRSRSQ